MSDETESWTTAGLYADSVSDYLRDRRQPLADFVRRITLGKLLSRHAVERRRIEPALGPVSHLPLAAEANSSHQACGCWTK
jgi:hypothetical protein